MLCENKKNCLHIGNSPNEINISTILNENQGKVKMKLKKTQNKTQHQTPNKPTKPRNPKQKTPIKAKNSKAFGNYFSYHAVFANTNNINLFIYFSDTNNLALDSATNY